MPAVAPAVGGVLISTMEPRAEFVESHRPPGGRRSSKRDTIVNYFLQQEGHLSADELVDALRAAGHRISRATTYRTLQWMVEAGIARKVDFGEGRARFEHAYRHPRHFHLICRSCSQSFEFISSDIEGLIEEIADDRGFETAESVVQIHGTCESCKVGRFPSREPMATELLFARDALRIAIATERSGLEFYTRAARLTKDERGREIFLKLAEEEKEHLGTLLARYTELLEQTRGLADISVLQGGRPWSLRGRRGRTSRGGGRQGSAPDRHPLRAGITPILPALRQTFRGFRGEADFHGVRPRRAAAP